MFLHCARVYRHEPQLRAVAYEEALASFELTSGGESLEHERGGAYYEIATWIELCELDRAAQRRVRRS